MVDLPQPVSAVRSTFRGKSRSTSRSVVVEKACPWWFFPVFSQESYRSIQSVRINNLLMFNMRQASPAGSRLPTGSFGRHGLAPITDDLSQFGRKDL